MTGSLRGRLTVLVAVAGLIATAALTIGFNLLLRSNLDSDADRVLQARGSAALDSVAVRDGRVVTRETPDEAAPDSGVWIYQGTRSIERPIAPTDVDRVADMLARTGGTFAESNSEDLRLSALPIAASNGARVGSVVVALSVEPYERSASRALGASVIFAAVMLALIIVATRLVVNRALKPVADITAEAADWSEHDLDHRFHLGPPTDELTQLAATFDSMLARLAANLRHEQRLTAEISHELRTPLAAISAEAELALSRTREDEAYREAIRSIQRRAGELAEVMDTLLRAARDQAMTEVEADARAIAADAIAKVADGGVSGVAFTLGPGASPPLVAVGESTGRQILAPVLENAGRYGATRVLLTVKSRGDRVAFSVSDDGPGISAEESEWIFEPGRRGRAANSSAVEGGGLGLALSRRLARAVGGDVVVVARESGGLVEILLPSADNC